MMRNESITALRPQIHTIKTMNDMSDIEIFQNEVIRPILKYQNDLIVLYSISKALNRNSKFGSLITIEKERFLEKVILKDNKIKQELTGMVIGLFTTEELNIYLSKESEYKRRINSMVKERIFSTL